MVEMSGAQALVEALKRQDVNVIFGIIGGAVLPVYDALGESGIRHVHVRHELADVREVGDALRGEPVALESAHRDWHFIDTLFTFGRGYGDLFEAIIVLGHRHLW